MALQKTITHSSGIEIQAYWTITMIDLIAGIFEVRAYKDQEACYSGKQALDARKYQFSLTPTRQQEIYEEVEVIDGGAMDGQVVSSEDGIDVTGGVKTRKEMRGTGEYEEVANTDYIPKTGNPLEAIYILLKTKEEFKDAQDV